LVFFVCPDGNARLRFFSRRIFLVLLIFSGAVVVTRIGEGFGCLFPTHST
jgi:hypothetical protein